MVHLFLDKGSFILLSSPGKKRDVARAKIDSESASQFGLLGFKLLFFPGLLQVSNWQCEAAYLLLLGPWELC